MSGEFTLPVVAWITIITMFVARLLAMKFDWRTRVVIEMSDPSELLVNQMRPFPQTLKGSQHKIMNPTSLRKKKTKYRSSHE